MKNFGNLNRDDEKYSNCFLEFNPIPFRKNRRDSLFWNYIANGCYDRHSDKEIRTREEFLEYIKDDRLKLLKEKLEEYGSKIIVFYSKSYGKYLFPLADNGKIEYIDVGEIEKGKGTKKRREKISISFFEYKNSKVFVIPHSSYFGMTLGLFKKIGEEIKARL